MKTQTTLSKKQKLNRGEISKAFFGAFIDKLIAFNLPQAIGLLTFGEKVNKALEISRNYEKFCKELGSIRTDEGATRCWDAIEAGVHAILDFKSKNRSQLSPNCLFRILCLTDGEDTASKSTPESVMPLLRKNNIILDSIPIEGKHSFLRGLTNYSGGLCFKVTDYESGLTLFECEPLLSLQHRQMIPANKLPAANIGINPVINFFPYTDTPPFKLPENLKMPANKKPGSNLFSTQRIQRILQEYKDMESNPHPLFELFVGENDIGLWKIIYSGENNTHYYGYCWLLYITFPNEYPQIPLNLRFLTPIYHCNVNNDGKICHDILSTQWTPQTTVREVLFRVSELIKNPNALNALDSVKGSLYQENRPLYYQALAEHTKNLKQQNTRSIITQNYFLNSD